MGMLAFTLALLYPLAGLCAPVGRWQWDGSIPGSTASSVSVSLVLTGIALLLDVVVGTPVVLWGAGLPVEEVAQHAGTIAYALLCSVSQRVPLELR